MTESNKNSPAKTDTAKTASGKELPGDSKPADTTELSHGGDTSASGGSGANGEGTLDQLLAKAGDMKNRMSQMQNDIAEFRVEGSAADGLVNCACDGSGYLRSIKIDESLMNGSPAVLEELIVTAVGQAREEARKDASRRMSELLGGLPIPAALAGLISQFVSLR